MAGLVRIVSRALLRGELADWLVSTIGRRTGTAARAYRRLFFPALALCFALFVAAGVVFDAVHGDLKSQSIDLAVKARLMSPKPDPSILILDIDERSLSLLAESQGRWPWPRSVVAEMIANLQELGARSIILNVMFSDPDKANAQADSVFNEVARDANRAVFPLIRLNPSNDHLSQVKVTALPNSKILPGGDESKTIAVIIPFAPGTHDKIAVGNLKPDADGIVRRYPAWWHERGFEIPSLALRAVEISGGSPVIGRKAHENGIVLNWRNKGGSYKRISFADVFATMNGSGDADLKAFRDAIVVIGVSAPGIATVKATSADPLTDDNLILATAVDDLRNDTHLRVLPSWGAGLVSLVLLIVTATAFSLGVSEKVLNRFFAAGQSALVVITIGSVSLTRYLVDLSSSFMIVFSYFIVASLYLRIDRNATRGVPSFSEIDLGDETRHCLLLGNRTAEPAKLIEFRNKLEKQFGFKRVFFIDNAFGDGHLMGPACKNISFFLIFTTPALLERARSLVTESKIDMRSQEVILKPEDLLEKDRIKALLGSRLLIMAGELINEGVTAP